MAITPGNKSISGEGTLLQAYRGLNDVTYHVYDVTDSFYQLREDGEIVEEAAQRKLAEARSLRRIPDCRRKPRRSRRRWFLLSFTLAAKDSQQRDRSIYSP